jgi:hypothetical protein
MQKRAHGQAVQQMSADHFVDAANSRQVDASAPALKFAQKRREPINLPVVCALPELAATGADFLPKLIPRHVYSGR